MRHGESLGNVDDSAYVTTPDWQVPLTEKGKQQAFEAGKELYDIVGPKGKVFFYYSPYIRTKDTLHEIKKYFDLNSGIS